MVIVMKNHIIEAEHKRQKKINFYEHDKYQAHSQKLAK